jgi:hypothetical protein
MPRQEYFPLIKGVPLAAFMALKPSEVAGEGGARPEAPGSADRRSGALAKPCRGGRSVYVP